MPLLQDPQALWETQAIVSAHIGFEKNSVLHTLLSLP